MGPDLQLRTNNRGQQGLLALSGRSSRTRNCCRSSGGVVPGARCGWLASPSLPRSGASKTELSSA
jgi:hypothetical protein